MKRRNLASIVILAVVTVFAATAARADVPKYVFFFLGYGMAN